jgi:hypothetical protein
MAQARELGDKAMRNLARLREEASESMTTPQARISSRTWLAFVLTLLIEKLFPIDDRSRARRKLGPPHFQSGSSALEAQ